MSAIAGSTSISSPAGKPAASPTPSSAGAPLDTALAELQNPVLLRRRFVDEFTALAATASLRQLRLQRTVREQRVNAVD